LQISEQFTAYLKINCKSGGQGFSGTCIPKHNDEKVMPEVEKISYTVKKGKRFSLPPAGMSLIKLSLGGTFKLFPAR
jgi:hypothetical protein